MRLQRTNRPRGSFHPQHYTGRAMAGRAYKTEAVVLRSFRFGEADRVLHLYTLARQLKLLWLSGYLPHLTSCANCGADDVALVGYSPAAGGAVCAASNTGE